jgi:hypothetical protein
MAVRFHPRLEGLEDRWFPSQVGLTVNSLADSGPGTLRSAILTADAGSHSDRFTIGFGVTGKIDLQSPLPDLNNRIVIQGPGAASLTVERVASALLGQAGPDALVRRLWPRTRLVARVAEQDCHHILGRPHVRVHRVDSTHRRHALLVGARRDRNWHTGYVTAADKTASSTSGGVWHCGHG